MTKKRNQIIEYNFNEAQDKVGYDDVTKLMWRDELFKEKDYYVLRQHYKGKVVMITEDVTELYE